MTTINGTHNATLSSDVQMRVRAPEAPPQAPNTRGSVQESAHARAIPKPSRLRQLLHAHRVRNFASQHGRDAGTALKGSWVVTEVPPTIGAAARQILPARDVTSSRLVWTAATATGVVRFVVVTICWLIALAFAGRIRAAVATTVICVLIAVHVINSHLPG
jgi:hypothetical protein